MKEEIEKQADVFVEMFIEHQYGILPEHRAMQSAVIHVEGLISELHSARLTTIEINPTDRHLHKRIQFLTQVKEVLTNRIK